MDWTDLLNRHGDKLMLYARQWSREASAAEDFVQEGFVRFWRTHGQTELTEPVALAYLFTAVRRAALDRLRSERRRIVRDEQFAVEMPTLEAPLDLELDRQRIEAALALLPVEQREVVVMKIWGELTFQAVADVTNTSLGTVTSRYRYALAALRRQWAAELENSHER